MKLFNKIIIWMIIFCFIASYDAPLYAYTLIPEYLCEIGLKLYKQGYINDALQEFNKALIANPDYRPAREYVSMIQGKAAVAQAPVPALVVPAPVIAAPVARAPAMLPAPAEPKFLPPPVTIAPAPASVIKSKIKPEARPEVKPELKPESLVIQPPVKPKPVEPIISAPVLPSQERDRAMEAVIKKIETTLQSKPIVTPVAAPAVSLEKIENVMEAAMKKLEAAKPLLQPAAPAAPEPKPIPPQPVAAAAAKPQKEISLPQVLLLDESVKSLASALEIEQGKTIIISGRNIQRFLLTQPDVLNVGRKSGDELSVTATNFGYTYLHIWDDNGRWTLEFLTVPVRPTGPTYEEILRRSEERANTFKLRYNMDWNSFYSSLDGKTKNLKRSSYSYGHYLYFFGPSPYGDIDSTASVRALKKTTDLTYFTMGLTKGKIGPFEDFTLRGVDFSPGITNLEFTSPTLRGVMLESPAFNKKLDYTVFWGREGGGRFGGLSPGLSKTKHSFLSGLNTKYAYNKRQKYGFSVFHGWGRDRSSSLNRYGYNAFTDWDLGKLGMRYEAGFDSESLAHLFTTKYETSKLKFSEEIRNIGKRFITMTGTGWRVGELGSLSSLDYAFSDDINLNSRLDFFQDRLFPNPSAPDRWNTDFRTDLDWRLDSLSSFKGDYSFVNSLGRISPYRSFNTGVGLYKTFDWRKRVSTALSYRHQEDKHFNSSRLNYINEKISTGIRFSLVRELYYFLNKDFNWLHERFTGNDSRPEVLETGFDWSSQIFKSPFYGYARILYRDEKETGSPLSFLSGEDYIEGHTTLSYKPAPDQELYCSTRIRKVWPEQTDVNRRIEADFNAGMRYLWDTKMRWEPIGTIEGYVFKDMNSDGIREDGEQPLEGIRLWLGKKSIVSDASGHYKFDKIRARKAYVNLDTQTLPVGFVLTVPVTQEAGILNHEKVRLDFGVISRSEIWGIVFLDLNGDGAFNISQGEKGIKGVILLLESGLKAVTDGNGQYRFSNVSVGEHIVALDLNTLPVEYLPTVPLKKTTVVFEGVSYNYNIPVKKSGN